MVSRNWRRLAFKPAPTLFHAIFSGFAAIFHTLEASRLALRPSPCTCGLKFYRGSTVTNYFKFSLAGTSTIVLASKRLDCRLWKYRTAFTNGIEKEVVMIKTSGRNTTVNTAHQRTQP
jgi:hypothetical protein